MLHTIGQQIWKTQQGPQDWKRSVFIPIPLVSHASKVMLKILEARLQQYGNQEILDVQIGFRKGRRSRDQIAKIHWIIEKARKL